MFIDDLLEVFYDSPAETGGWDQVVLAMESQLKGGVAFFVRRPTGVATFGVCSNKSFDTMDLYERSLWQEDRAMRLITGAPQGRVLPDSEVVRDRERRQGPFYGGFMASMGLDRGLYASVLTDRDEQVVVAAQRNSLVGDWTQAEAGWLTEVAPHIARGYRTWRRLRDSEAMAEVASDALGRCGIGMLTVDSGLEVRFANRAAEDVLKHGTLRIQAGRLVTADAQSTAALHRAVRNATRWPDPETTALQAPISQPPFELTLSVMPAGRGRPASRLATVLVAAPALEHDASPLAAKFGLTPAEGRLLAALTSGERLSAYARRSGISLATAKTHLSSLFNKTGERRQADLLRRVLRETALLSATAPER